VLAVASLSIRGRCGKHEGKLGIFCGSAFGWRSVPASRNPSLSDGRRTGRANILVWGSGLCLVFAGQFRGPDSGAGADGIRWTPVVHRPPAASMGFRTVRSVPQLFRGQSVCAPSSPTCCVLPNEPGHSPRKQNKGETMLERSTSCARLQLSAWVLRASPQSGVSGRLAWSSSCGRCGGVPSPRGCEVAAPAPRALSQRLACKTAV
jgi:hypothetical protein